MNKQWVGACAMILLGGCASVEMAQYTETLFAEVPLKGGARVKIVASNDGLDTIVGALSAALKKSESIQVVDNNADYWFVLGSLSDYARSAPQMKLSVVTKENERAVWEDFDETARNLESAAIGVSVAVYDVKTLSPVHYFEIPMWDGNNTSKSVRGKLSYEKDFAKKVVARVKAAFVSQKRQVKITIPLDADVELRKRFIEGGKRFAAGDKQAYVPFIQKYKQMGTVDLKKLCEQLRAKTYKGEDADVKLCNYYLYLLAEEAMTHNPEMLASVKREQLMILEASDNKGLAEAVPVALARLEYKLANLGM